jgi:hypothetical protein
MKITALQLANSCQVCGWRTPRGDDETHRSIAARHQLYRRNQAKAEGRGLWRHEGIVDFVWVLIVLPPGRPKGDAMAPMCGPDFVWLTEGLSVPHAGEMGKETSEKSAICSTRRQKISHAEMQRLSLGQSAWFSRIDRFLSGTSPFETVSIF